MRRISILVSGCSVLFLTGWLVVVATFKQTRLANETFSSPDRLVDHGAPAPVRQLPEDVVGQIPAPKEVNFGDLKGKSKMRSRGVVVDRRTVIEDVTLDDLRAPEGRLWIPASMLGPVKPGSVDPFGDVLVAYCLLDMAAYHETPWLFAMGTFHQRQSGCVTDPSLVKTYRLSDLEVSRFFASVGTLTRCRLGKNACKTH